jgi:excisionase family DNA binding protein
MTTNEASVLTRKEAAALFRVSTKTLERWEAAGILTPIRIGVNVRYRREDVQALLDGQAASA